MARRAPTVASATKLTSFLLERGLGGVPPLSSAEDLATEYLIDQGYENHDQRVESLVNWETTKNFTSGFITGLGGVIALPIAIPSALAASWVLQARMAGAIAKIYGHDLRLDRVRTLILLSLAGDVAKEAMQGHRDPGRQQADRACDRAGAGPGAGRDQQAHRCAAAHQGRRAELRQPVQGRADRRWRGRGIVRCGGLSGRGPHGESAVSAVGRVARHRLCGAGAFIN
jgi:hypothetical protein